MKALHIAVSAFAVLVALLPLLSTACSNGNSCLRLSDCADGMTCQAGMCAPANAVVTDADTEGSVTSDANAQSQDSETVDGSASTTDANDGADGDQTDGDAGNDGESSTQAADAG